MTWARGRIIEVRSYLPKNYDRFLVLREDAFENARLKHEVEKKKSKAARCLLRKQVRRSSGLSTNRTSLELDLLRAA